MLCRCLDARGSPAAAFEGDHAAILALEGLAVDASVALTLKLTEAAFTPAFLALVEWARSAEEPVPRLTALFRLATALTGSLRGVFVPYFQHLVDDALAALALEAGEGGDSAAAAEAAALSSAKKKKKGGKRARVAALALGSAASPLAAWQLRVEVVRALAACFGADSVGFLDEDRFHALLPPLLAQLEAQQPEEAPEEEVAAAGNAIVACLVKMAQAAGSDTLWRPLNRGALMATRSEVVRPRRLGVSVAEGLLDALAEEYLVLLPETIPFLAELCEDPDEEVEAIAKRLTAKLTEMSGEDIRGAMAT